MRKSNTTKNYSKFFVITEEKIFTKAFLGFKKIQHLDNFSKKKCKSLY
jgi:hypothetical protein